MVCLGLLMLRETGGGSVNKLIIYCASLYRLSERLRDYSGSDVVDLHPSPIQ